MLSIVVPQGVRPGHMVSLAMDCAITEQAWGTVHACVGGNDSGSRDAVPVRLKPTHDHASPKFGKDLEEVCQ